MKGHSMLCVLAWRLRLPQTLAIHDLGESFFYPLPQPKLL
jgi:hypothetical protein